MPSQRLIKNILTYKLGFHNIKHVYIKGFLLNIKHEKVKTCNPSMIHNECSMQECKILYTDIDDFYILYTNKKEITSDIEFLKLWNIKIYP
jgi:hypothetical protein